MSFPPTSILRTASRTRRPRDEGDDVREAEANVDHEAAVGIRRMLQAVGIGGQVRRGRAQDGLESVLVEEELVETVLDGGKVEVGLRHDQVLLAGVELEAVLAEEVVEDGLLVVPVDEVALLKGEQVEEGAQIAAVVDLVGNEGAPFLALGLHDAVGEDATRGRVGEPGLDGRAAYVHHKCWRGGRHVLWRRSHRHLLFWNITCL